MKLSSDWRSKSHPLRVALTIEMMKKENHKMRLEELEKLPGKHLKAQQQIELYQIRISTAYNKKVKVQTFKKGNLVLTVRRPNGHNTQDEGKIPSEIGRSVCSRVRLLKRGIS